MASTSEEIRRITSEVEADVPVSPLEGYAAILKELDAAEEELKMIKKGLKELWHNIKADELADAVAWTDLIETEAEKMALATIRTSATARAFRDAFIRRGGEGWHY